MIDIAFHLQAADNGFVVESALKNGSPTTLRVFATFENAAKHIIDNMTMIQCRDDRTIASIEREAISTLLPKD